MIFRILLACTFLVSTASSGVSRAQGPDHFSAHRNLAQPPALTFDAFRYGAASDQTIHVTVPRRDEPVPILIWFPWTYANMSLHQDRLWMGAFAFEQGIATANINVAASTTKDVTKLAAACARAVGEIVRQANKHGYTADRIILAGQGWGAQMAALFATNPGYAMMAGVPFESFRGLLLIEPAGLDADRERTLASRYVLRQLTKLATDETVLREHSATPHVAPPNAPFALILRSQAARERADLDTEFAHSLRTNGAVVIVQTLAGASSDMPGTMIGGPRHVANKAIQRLFDEARR